MATGVGLSEGRSWGRSARRGTPALAAVLLTVTSCSALSGDPVPTPHDGPLAFGGAPGTLCLDAGDSPDYTFGFDSMDNTTDRDLTVESVRLVGATNISMVGVGHLAPIEDMTAIGAMRGWPPVNDPPAFERRRPMPTVVAAGESLNLVMHVRATVPAQVEAVEVTYTGAGRAKRVRNSTVFQVRDRC